MKKKQKKQKKKNKKANNNNNNNKENEERVHDTIKININFYLYVHICDILTPLIEWQYGTVQFSTEQYA